MIYYLTQLYKCYKRLLTLFKLVFLPYVLTTYIHYFALQRYTIWIDF